MKHARINYLKAKIILWLFGIKISRKRFEELERQQRVKGLRKYHQTLENQDYNAFDWQEMATEEIIDFLAYVKKFKSIKGTN